MGDRPRKPTGTFADLLGGDKLRTLRETLPPGTAGPSAKEGNTIPDSEVQRVPGQFFSAEKTAIEKMRLSLQERLYRAEKEFVEARDKGYQLIRELLAEPTFLAQLAKWYGSRREDIRELRFVTEIERLLGEEGRSIGREFRERLINDWRYVQTCGIDQDYLESLAAIKELGGFIDEQVCQGNDKMLERSFETKSEGRTNFFARYNSVMILDPEYRFPKYEGKGRNWKLAQVAERMRELVDVPPYQSAGSDQSDSEVAMIIFKQVTDKKHQYVQDRISGEAITTLHDLHQLDPRARIRLDGSRVLAMSECITRQLNIGAEDKVDDYKTSIEFNQLMFFLDDLEKSKGLQAVEVIR